jgi:hypothetical protein
LETGALVRQQCPEQNAQSAGMRQQFRKGQSAENTFSDREFRSRVEVGAASFHDPSEVHSARTDAFAVAAHEALLDVLAVRRVWLDAALAQRLDQMDPTAR